MKRLFDICLALVALLIALPVMLVIALLIAFCMPDGPVFFSQTRIGRYGLPFKMIKFRTMTAAAAGSSVTVAGDNRVTPLGAVLRKYKLDELPELLNVLKGDMSMVGPRPDVPGYADKLEGEERKILELRPGVTGPATLKYRNEEVILAAQPDPQRYNDEVIWRDKVAINLQYFYEHSILSDIKILVDTIL